MTFLLILWLGADLAAIKAEPALDKRAVRAVDAALVDLASARKSYDAGEVAAFQTSLRDVVAAADLSMESLEAMGRHPSRNIRNYKMVETKFRELQRKIATLRSDASVEERPAVEKAERRINEIHEKLVTGIMSRRP